MYVSRCVDRSRTRSTLARGHNAYSTTTNHYSTQLKVFTLHIIVCTFRKSNNFSISQKNLNYQFIICNVFFTGIIAYLHYFNLDKKKNRSNILISSNVVTLEFMLFLSVRIMWSRAAFLYKI